MARTETILTLDDLVEVVPAATCIRRAAEVGAVQTGQKEAWHQVATYCTTLANKTGHEIRIVTPT